MATKQVGEMRIRVTFPGDRQLAFHRVYNSQIVLNSQSKYHVRKNTAKENSHRQKSSK